MNIKSYINESEKQYRLRLKTLATLDDEAMTKIENTVSKYQPISMTRPKKTIMQSNPLDFPDVESGEVWILDMIFGLPAAPHILRADIRKSLNAPESHVFVRNINEPGELQSEILNAISDIEAEASKKGLRLMAMLNDPDYNESNLQNNQDLFGNDYNAAFLGYLANVEKERKDSIQRVENAPFNWLDLPDRKDQEPVQDNSNFNSHIKDAPEIAPTKFKITIPDYSVFGNFNPENNEIRKVYTDDKGNKVVLSRKLRGDI